MQRLSNAEVAAARLSDWRILQRKLHTRFATGNFAAGASLVAAIAELADAADHHPEVHLSYPFVAVELTSHEADGLTHHDVDLARQISDLAADRGIDAAPLTAAAVEIALDSADPEAIAPFWAAVITGSAENVRESDDVEVVDPTEQVPLLWFQQTEPHSVPRQRFHLDIWVPQEAVADRIAAAIEAGGAVVDDGPETFTVLADAEGNRACLCIAEGR